ncbi:type I restriction endonuclease subunit S [Flavobacterium limi]|uniref:Type I restriction endonuclease subunit S n=1 Tax=Flavobacterium limi TaxID=2045105 RepID=A0ABQ1TX53_9FLAO|nr:type I restriction endonuclease subunit S [Flavobacterium limi]
MGNILTVASGRDYKHLVQGSIPVYGTGGYMTSVDSYLYDGETVCIGRKGTINKPFYFNGKFWTVDTLFYTHSFKKVLPKFVYHIFEQINWLKYNEASGVPSLSKSTIDNIDVNISSLNEQLKISSFISLIDERIETQNKIIEQLETLIKTVSEKLFSQKLRFEGFCDNWQEKKLGDIGMTYNGLSGKSKDDFGSGKKYIQYKQIFDKLEIDVKKCGLVNVNDNENQNQVEYGDVFFTISSETSREIGMSSVLLEKVEDVYLNSFCFGYRIFSFEILAPEFAKFFFRSDCVRNSIIKLAQGSTRFNMSKIELLKLKIIVPSIEEQNKIANFLSSIDTKIDIENQLLQKLEEQKKFLLHQIFV